MAMYSRHWPVARGASLTDALTVDYQWINFRALPCPMPWWLTTSGLTSGRCRAPCPDGWLPAD